MVVPCADRGRLRGSAAHPLRTLRGGPPARADHGALHPAPHQHRGAPLSDGPGRTQMLEPKSLSRARCVRSSTLGGLNDRHRQSLSGTCPELCHVQRSNDGWLPFGRFFLITDRVLRFFFPFEGQRDLHFPPSFLRRLSGTFALSASLSTPARGPHRTLLINGAIPAGFVWVLRETFRWNDPSDPFEKSKVYGTVSIGRP